MKIKNLLNLVVASIIGVSCASVNTISVSSIPKERSRMVKAVASRLIILGFNFDNDFVDSLVDDLKSQCKGGMVSGILTKDEVISYVFAHKRVITARGFCDTSSVQ